MGFDVSWHPISQREMVQWYFDPLERARAGDLSPVRALAEEYQLGRAAGYEDVCRERYVEMMETAAAVGPEESFDKTHSFILAAVQGLFRTYYYTRGGLYSNLVQIPEMAAYTLPFEKILGERLKNPVRNRITENYSGGVYIPEDQVPRLLADCESGAARGPLEQVFGNTLPVFLKALNHAKREGLGLLEATEVVEPNPLDIQSTTCRSYLMNCDFDGVAVYVETAKRQIEEAIRAQGGDPSAPVTRVVQHVDVPPDPPARKPPAKKKGLLGRLFGGERE